jgi:hypothetical protein
VTFSPQIGVGCDKTRVCEAICLCVQNNCTNKVSLIFLLSNACGICASVSISFLTNFDHRLWRWFVIKPPVSSFSDQDQDKWHNPGVLLVLLLSLLFSSVVDLAPFTLWLISQTEVKGLVAGLHGGYIVSSYHYHGSHKMLQVPFYFY